LATGVAANDRTYEQRLGATKMIVSAEDTRPTILGVLVLGLRTQDFLPGAYTQFLRSAGGSRGRGCPRRRRAWRSSSEATSGGRLLPEMTRASGDTFRFPIRFERWYSILSSALLLFPSDSYVEVGDGNVECRLEPPQRARVLGVPVRLRQLLVSVDDPDAIADRLTVSRS